MEVINPFISSLSVTSKMQNTSFCNYEIEISKLQCQIVLVTSIIPLD